MSGIPEEFEGLTLSNCVEGKLEETFQDQVIRALEVFEESGLGDRYEASGAGTLSCTLVAEVELEYDCEQGTIAISARMKPLKEPKRRETRRAGYIRDGAILVEKMKQSDLPMESNVRRLTGDKE